MDDLMRANDISDVGVGFGVAGIGSSKKSLSSTVALYLLSVGIFMPFSLLCSGQRDVGWKGIPLCSECVLYYVYSLTATWARSCFCDGCFLVSDEISDDLVRERTDRALL